MVAIYPFSKELREKKIVLKIQFWGLAINPTARLQKDFFF
jgi:hypothetical protein